MGRAIAWSVLLLVVIVVAFAVIPWVINQVTRKEENDEHSAGTDQDD